MIVLIVQFVRLERGREKHTQSERDTREHIGQSAALFGRSCCAVLLCAALCAFCGQSAVLATVSALKRQLAPDKQARDWPELEKQS